MSEPRGKHEIKTCPRCGRPFACRSHNPVHCDCARVTLDEGTLGAIEGHYRDCLCLACLTALAAGADLALTGSGDIAPTPNPVS